MYAGDTSLLAPDNVVFRSKTNALLKTVDVWYKSNHLYFNREKTQVIRFRNTQKYCDKLRLSISDSNTLTFEKEIKFLGVTIDECLN